VDILFSSLGLRIWKIRSRRSSFKIDMGILYNLDYETESGGVPTNIGSCGVGGSC